MSRLAVAAIAVVCFGVGLALSGLLAPAPSAIGAAPARDLAEQYTCAMHPQVRADEPGACPLCGMDLVPVGDATALAPGQVALSERARQLARVETVAVHTTSASSMPIQLLGKVDYDETGRKTVTSWIGGRIDRLDVAATGVRIRAGQRVAVLYSPDIYAAHSDLLQAAEQVSSLAGGSELARRAARASLESVRERLRLLGVPDRELARMEKATSPWRQIPIRSAFAGTVIERLVDEGMYVQPGSGLYRLAGLSKLWVQLDAYESDLPHIRKGDTVRLTVDALPGQEFEGTVSFIAPTLDARTRTARVRVEVKNRDGLLRPGMFAQATVATGGAADSEPVLTIPESAPLFTGRRSLVFVEASHVPDTGLAIYEAREVELGPRTGRVYPVLGGLRAGERIVARGAFALDADLQIRGGRSMMARPHAGEDAASGPAVATVEDLPADARTALSAVVAAYLDTQRALAGDDLDAARTAAGELGPAIAAVDEALPPEHRPRWRAIGPRFGAAANAVASGGDLASARRAFETASAQLGLLLAAFGNATDEPVVRAYCPMALGNRGATWFQTGQVVDNAYEGLAMRSCGSVTDAVEPGAFLDAATAPAEAAATGAHQH